MQCLQARYFVHGRRSSGLARTLTRSFPEGSGMRHFSRAEGSVRQPWNFQLARLGKGRIVGKVLCDGFSVGPVK
jgi:hypothetical protein